MISFNSRSLGYIHSVTRRRHTCSGCERLSFVIPGLLGIPDGFSFWPSDPLTLLMRIFLTFGSYSTQRMGLFMSSVSAVFNILGPFSWELEACKIQARVPKEVVGLMLGVTSFLVLFPFSVPQVTQEEGRVIPFFHQWGSTWLADSHTHRLMCLRTVWAIMAGTALFIPWCIFHQTSYFVHTLIAYTLALKSEVWH